MIKCDKGNLEIRGTVIDLLAELATLVHALKSDFTEVGMPEKEADELLEKAVNDGLMAEEELDKTIEEKKAAKKEKVMTPEEAMQRLIEMLEAKFAKGEEE